MFKRSYQFSNLVQKGNVFYRVICVSLHLGQCVDLRLPLVKSLYSEGNEILITYLFVDCKASELDYE